MEVLFHFIFELIKISILGSIYATLSLMIFLVIGKRKHESWFAKVSKKKLRLWFLSGLFISIGLFAFMFTYWGDHGLGDGPKIPIGNGIIVDNTNWTEYGYIKDLKTNDNIDIEMTQFKVIDDKLIGNLDSWFYDFENSFFAYDMDSEKLIEFKTKNEFDDYLIKNELGTSSDLLTFSENYSNHWSGWRFWLLP
tara:strand:- start:122 stop:703 length:582 start_codon:yes stop_codon:yes gene_type:complete